jgi:stress-induced morphogen
VDIIKDAPKDYLKDLAAAKTLEKKINEVLPKAGFKIEEIYMRKMAIFPGTFFYTGVVTSPSFQGMTQERRHSELSRQLKPYLTKEEIDTLSPLTFTPEEYKGIEEDG